MSRRGERRVKCEVEVEFGDSQEGFIVYNALKPDIARAPLKRARLDIRLEGKVLKLTINAQDLTALRALANSTLKYLDLARRVMEVV